MAMASRYLNTEKKQTEKKKVSLPDRVADKRRWK